MNQQDRHNWQAYKQSTGARNEAALPTYGITTNNSYDQRILHLTDHGLLPGQAMPINDIQHSCSTQITTGSSTANDNDKSLLLSEVLGLMPMASVSMLKGFRDQLKSNLSSPYSSVEPFDPNRVSMYPVSNMVQSHHASSNAQTFDAHQADIANQDVPQAAQHAWMSAVQPDSLVASTSFPTAGLNLGHARRQIESMSWETTEMYIMSQPNRFSDASSAQGIRDSVASSRSSLHPHDSSRMSQSSAASLASSLLRPKIFDNARESVQSFSSYDSTSTRPGVPSKHSSTTSSKSQGPSLMATMSSGTGRGHRRATSNGSSSTRQSSSSRQSVYHCTEADCDTTCKRESDRERHIQTVHDNVLFKCLLHTCTSKCPKDCQDVQHTCTFPRARRDKVRKHLEDVHGIKISSKDMPEAWIWSYIRQRAGWSCSSCGVFLGNWIENSKTIAGHSQVCTDGLSNLVRRLSVEKPGEGRQKWSNNNEPEQSDSSSAGFDTEANEDDSSLY